MTALVLRGVRPYGEDPVDLVIEAVFEDPKIKADVTAKVEAVTDCVYATNTSTLSVIDMAVATQRPDKVVGVHMIAPEAPTARSKFGSINNCATPAAIPQMI